MRHALGFAAVVLLIAGCATPAPSSPGPSAVADVAPTKGNNVKGKVFFTEQGKKVLVVANLSGLPPGDHGFHVHEKGDCSSDDGMSAGGHFNPFGKPHGNPASADRHVGDMPMVKADAAGNATLSVELDTMTVGGSTADIIGKSVIVHKDADDFTTQPTGNSGARLACGVIHKA